MEKGLATDTKRKVSDRRTASFGMFRIQYQRLVRWLRVILRRDRYRVEECMKFGTKNLVGIRNKFSLVAT